MCVEKVENRKVIFSRFGCYEDKDKKGLVVEGLCCGTVGGDRSTSYLSYSCVDCPHYIWNNEV